MASGSSQGDVELLRAIAHARMYATSGRGIESVVYALAHGDLGAVSNALHPALERMEMGEEAGSAVSSVMNETAETHLRAFLAALLASGTSAVQRLDELADQLHTEREARAVVQGERLSRIVNFTALLFVLSFFPVMGRICEDIPDNPLLPTVTYPYWFEPVYFGGLAIVLTGLLLSSRSS